MLQALHPARGILVGEGLYQVFRFGQLAFLHFEPTEVESRNGLRSLTLPHRHVLPAFVALTDQFSGGGNLHPFWNVESHVITDTISERRVGIPVFTRYREVIPSAFVRHRFLPAVDGGDSELIARGKRLRKDH